MEAGLPKITPLILGIVLVFCFFGVVMAAPADMADSSVPVDQAVEDAAAAALGQSPPITDTVDYYAITHVRAITTTNHYLLSVTALDVDDPGSWNIMDHALWEGLVIVHSDQGITYTAGVQDTITFTNIITGAGLDGGYVCHLTGENCPAYSYDAQAAAEVPIFPWTQGTKMWYSDLKGGVHEGTDGLAGDRAVDWVSGDTYGSNAAPNMVYTSQSGYVDYLCNDDFQTTITIGNFGYMHLQPNPNIYEGQYYQRGQAIGPLVYGNIDKELQQCGYAEQRATSFHLHWSFKPSNGYFRAENWTLTVSDSTWRNGSDVVRPGANMWAYWSGEPIPPPPTVTPGGPTITPGGPTVTPNPGVGDPGASYTMVSFWNPILVAIWNMSKIAASRLPDHNEFGIMTTILQAADTVLRVTFVLVKSNFDMQIVFLCAGIIMFMETIGMISKVARMIAAAIRFVLSFIPFLG